uniref:Uncharacterized protein n=1 Tax=Opuntia streptacantha TaxID=393608 RepID=A0A7C9DLY9_OPUST
MASKSLFSQSLATFLGSNHPSISLLLTKSSLLLSLLSPNVDSSSFLPPQIYGLLSQALDQMQPQVKTLLTQLQPDIVFFDFVQHWLPPLASELGIKSANFSVFSAVANSYLVVPSRMPDPNQPPTIEDLKKPPPGFPETSVTGVRTFQAQDFMFLFKGSNGGAHRLLKDPVGETSSFGWPCCSHAALRNPRSKMGKMVRQFPRNFCDILQFWE